MIPRLEDLSIRHRILLTIAIVVIILLLMAMVGFLGGRWEEAQGQEAPKYEPLLVMMDKRALEAAYHDHLKLLFSVWLKDDVRATERISKGLGIARRAYAAAADQIERREKALAGR
jgi:hypothetical protein